MKDNEKIETTSETEQTGSQLSENWPEEAVQDILDYIEEQGIYIRE